MHSKMDALEKLARHLGMYEKDNHQKSDPLALRNMTDAERSVRMHAVLSSNPSLASTLAQLVGTGGHAVSHVPDAAELMKALQGLSPEQRAAVDSFLMMANPAVWVPQAGPQSAAFHSQADILFYGGSAGGGNTDLLLGLPLTEQERSIVSAVRPCS
ncbi:hypothetical protein [Paracidovorax avenae]|uniref:hypothetical protein n=1 Tax=Paracidovorax avenae TaxID=80867 RepID=UPI001864DA3F|nr:hypothetical protein [Paracidovorax avenae]